jgi:hypothetical protein
MESLQSERHFAALQFHNQFELLDKFNDEWIKESSFVYWVGIVHSIEFP